MSDSAGEGKGPGEVAGQPGGVLGNLPRSRPSVRSPRRAAAKPDESGPEPGSEASGDGSAGEREPSPQADLETLARGGLAIAGGAASLGLRLAGRAAGAVRDAVERR